MRALRAPFHVMTVTRSPFDVLLKDAGNQDDLMTADAEATLRLSIQQHLARLFNARQGVLPHLPDYGLPDLTAVYQEMPYSVDELLKSVKKTIEKYEPRLKYVDVRKIDVNGNGFVISMEVSGRTINGEILKFETYFISGGKARVGIGRIM